MKEEYFEKLMELIIEGKSKGFIELEEVRYEDFKSTVLLSSICISRDTLMKLVNEAYCASIRTSK